MNTEFRPLKTAAEQGLAEAFASAKGFLPGRGQVADLRAQAFHRFEVRGLPNRRIEDWKYTDLRALMREAKPLAQPPGVEAKQQAKGSGAGLGNINSRRLVFVDGAFIAEASDIATLEAGLAIGSLADALGKGDAEVIARLGSIGAPDSDVAFALNTAFMGDGAIIGIAPGTMLKRPIHLVFVTSGEAAAATFTRSLVIAGKGACAMLIESHEGPAGCGYQVNTALELAVGDEAQVDHVKVTVEGDQALHVSTLTAAIGAHARFNDLVFTTGGAVVRNQLFLRFDGEGAVANVRGASLLRGRQHTDTTLVADHVAGGCHAHEVFKSVLDEQSHAVFQGKIIVRPGAQKTDARMMTRALLLSETAEADAKPELEIFADDVQCGHGATSGALDDELRFYLMARGIPANEAESLLIQAFVGEAIDGVDHAELREGLMDAARAWLAARG